MLASVNIDEYIYYISITVEVFYIDLDTKASRPPVKLSMSVAIIDL